MKILMVCIGNICRSPMAEYILKQKAQKFNKDWTIESAGIQDHHVGEKAHQNTIKICNELGIDTSQHKAQQVNKKHMQQFDKIYAFEKDVYTYLVNLDPDMAHKVDYFTNELNPNCNEDVIDPWYHDFAMYKKVSQQIIEISELIVKKY